MNWDKSSQRDTGCLPVALLGNRSWPRRVENSSTRANGEYNGAIRVVCWGEDGNMPKLCPWANRSLKWLQVAFVQEWKYLYLRSVQNITLSIQKGLCHLYVLLQLYVHILYLNIWFPMNISCNSPEHIKVASYFCLARPPISAARPPMAAGTASKVNLRQWQQALFSHFSFWGLYAVVKSPAGRVWLTGRQGRDTTGSMKKSSPQGKHNFLIKKSPTQIQNSENKNTFYIQSWLLWYRWKTEVKDHWGKRAELNETFWPSITLEMLRKDVWWGLQFQAEGDGRRTDSLYTQTGIL